MISVNIGPSISELWSGSWDKSVNVLSIPFNFEENPTEEVAVAVLNEPNNDNIPQKAKMPLKRSSSALFSRKNVKKNL